MNITTLSSTLLTPEDVLVTHLIMSMIHVRPTIIHVWEIIVIDVGYKFKGKAR
jgi:hypothetical protein